MISEIVTTRGTLSKRKNCGILPVSLQIRGLNCQLARDLPPDPQLGAAIMSEADNTMIDTNRSS